MSVIQDHTQPNPVRVECTLSASENYIESLTITAIQACPGLTELAIRSQLLSAIDPERKQLKAQCFVPLDHVIELKDAVDQFLRLAGAAGEAAQARDTGLEPDGGAHHQV